MQIDENNMCIPTGINYLTMYDEINKLLCLSISVPKELATEVEVKYNMRPKMPCIVDVRKEVCTNSMLLSTEKNVEKQNVISGVCPWIISDISLSDTEVTIRQVGIGGGRESIMGSLGADGVLRHEINELDEKIDVNIVSKLYKRLVIGIDSTDSKLEGCTLYLCHNIGKKIAAMYEDNVKYIRTQGSILNVRVPNKTQNNSASTLVLAVTPQIEREVIGKVYELVKKYSVSKSAYITVFSGLKVPEEIHEFALRAKKEILTIDDAKEILEKYNIENREVTGIQGIIGATAAIGFVDDIKNGTQVAY